jgi:hypothetical protein
MSEDENPTSQNEVFTSPAYGMRGVWKCIEDEVYWD